MTDFEKVKDLIIDMINETPDPSQCSTMEFVINKACIETLLKLNKKIEKLEQESK